MPGPSLLVEDYVKKQSNSTDTEIVIGTYFVLLGTSESEVVNSMALLGELKRTLEKLLHRFVMYSVLGRPREIVVGLRRDPCR